LLLLLLLSLSSGSAAAAAEADAAGAEAGDDDDDDGCCMILYTAPRLPPTEYRSKYLSRNRNSPLFSQSCQNNDKGRIMNIIATTTTNDDDEPGGRAVCR
jgi:hypothetical protein